MDMDDVIELQRRKIALLGNNTLNNLVDKMIKTKGLPAKLDSITLITDNEGKTRISVRLYVNRVDTGKKMKVYLYITEDIFYLNKEKSFERID